jgi:hypothetical protein
MARGELQRTAKLIKAAQDILAEQSPMTIRQLFYRLVSIEAIKNTRNDYQRVSSVMTKARNDGRVSFDDIVDRSRPEYCPSVWRDAWSYGRTVSRSYRKDYWDMQPERCEVWVEKDAVIGSIEDTTDSFGVTIRVGRGFLSTTKAHDVAQVIESSTKPMTVFYLGDHDPSGCCIEPDLHRRIAKYGAKFKITRLAIHAKDIRAFNLPPLRVKTSDSRASSFVRQYGRDCVELDALPPVELRRRITEAIEALIDRESWDRAVQVEQVELESIRELAARWPGQQSTQPEDSYEPGEDL